MSDFNISTDIYDIRDSVDKIKARFINDEDETTLALGIFGFLGDVEAKKIQISTVMAGELGNEMFPSRAKLDKNILTHAIYCNIEGINAVPAELTINIGIKTSDLDIYMNHNEFVFDHKNAIFIGNYIFHLDYDIILKRYKPAGSDTYIYTAMYDMSNPNNISKINNAYLAQPLVQNFNNFSYVFFTTTIHQVSIGEVEDTIITRSIIDNKSYTFSFDGQLADFEVYVTDNDVETRLTPLFYGSPVEQGVTKYCWYLYVNDNTVRVSFDSNSYTPGLNSKIHIITRTTSGAAGNFTYNDTEENDLYCDFVSTYSNNKKITCYIRTATDSVNGADRKSIDELKSLIPKMAMSRGYITTETDLNNYFNLISDEENIIKLQEKVDNQISRIWYAYYLLKDENENMIPANTFRIKFQISDPYVVKVSDGRYIIPCGTNFLYDPKVGYGVYIAESDVPEPFSDAYYDDTKNLYYYKSIQNIVINEDPLYCAYYLTTVNHDSYFNYKFANQNCYLGFTTIRNHFERKMLTNNMEYNFTFNITQSINQDYGLLEIDQDTKQLKHCDIKCFLVIYQNHAPYRYQECTIEGYSEDLFTTQWKASLETDNAFDTANRIKLTNLYEAGYNSKNYGFFENNCEAYLYVAAKFDQVYPDEDHLLSKICPGYDDYSLLNIYEIEGGLTFFENFTDVMNTRIVVNKSEDESVVKYDIYGIPMVGYHYFQNEDKVTYLINKLSDRKAYIDHCLQIVENTMKIDFKFFNTYGQSATYTIGDKEETSLGHLDISMKFRLRLLNSSDTTTKDSIVEYIKNYMEDLDKLSDIHIPNLIHDITETYKDTIEFIEFMNFNNNRLGIQHMLLRDVTDPHVVPEFINIRNRLADDGETLKPDIEIELVMD